MGSSDTDREADDGTRVTVTVGASPPRVEGGALRAGEEVGRYTVVGELGRGGMGVVYRAYDPELDRMVAVKLLPLGAATDAAELQSARDRLRREAQALAQLSHPNVVAVHDVGDCDAGVYVAMELVEGETARDWARANRPDWREVLHVLLAAGRGLAAAHRANLVHRDFKPSNLVLSSDGTAKVIDFGLARATDEREMSGPMPLGHGSGHAGEAEEQGDEAEEQAGDAGSDPRRPSARTGTTSVTPLSSSLTRTGAILGSPRYMSPEQHTGRPAGPASDQFSFCVAAWELFYGQTPFDGDTREALFAEVTRGRLVDTPAGTRVPHRIERALRRGLATGPRDRFPSMDALLAELALGARSRTRRLAVAVAGVAALAAAGWIGASTRADRASLCAGGADRFAAVWSPERRPGLERAFAATGSHHATATAALVDDALRRYGEHWTSAYTAACKATHERGEQSAQLLDQRMRCLARGLDRTRAVVAELESNRDAALVNRAVQVAGAERRPSECLGDPSALIAEAALPRDPAERERITETRAKLDAARARLAAGRFEDAATALAAVVETADDIGFAPLQGDARYWAARADSNAGHADRAEDRLREGFGLAARAADDRLTARLWLALLDAMRHDQERTAETLRYLPFAEAAIERAGAARDLELVYNNVVGILFVKKGDYEGARAYFERRLALAEELYGDDHLDAGRARTNLGLLLYYDGDYERARPLLTSALATLSARLGDAHPDTSTVRMNLALTLRAMNEFDDAIRALEKVVEVRRRALREGHPKIANALSNLADTLVEHGTPAPAIPLLLEALTILEKAHGPDHVEVAWPLVALGKALGDVGKFEQAVSHLERALAVRRAGLGEEHPDTASVMHNLGDLAEARGRTEEAVKWFEQALALRVAAFGNEHPHVATTRQAVADSHLRALRPARAVPYLEAILAVDELDDETLALARFGLARARWSLDQDRAEAVRLARETRTLLADKGRADAARRVTEWLERVAP